MENDIFLSVVIPQYNELINLQKGVLGEVYNFLTQQSFNWELIVVDDGSTDGSTDFTTSLNFSRLIYLKEEHRGKAGALEKGVERAIGKYILVTDMDQSTPITELNKLFPFLNEAEAIIGSRGNKRNSSSIIRKFASFIFSTFRRALILHDIKDTQCGFKLFKSETIKNIFPKLDAIKNTSAKGWTVTAYDVELLYLIRKAGFKIKEVEVMWKNEDQSNSKDRNFVFESIDMLRQIFHILWNNLQGRY